MAREKLDFDSIQAYSRIETTSSAEERLRIARRVATHVSEERFDTFSMVDSIDRAVRWISLGGRTVDAGWEVIGCFDRYLASQELYIKTLTPPGVNTEQALKSLKESLVRIHSSTNNYTEIKGREIPKSIETVTASCIDAFNAKNQQYATAESAKLILCCIHPGNLSVSSDYQSVQDYFSLLTPAYEAMLRSERSSLEGFRVVENIVTQLKVASAGKKDTVIPDLYRERFNGVSVADIFDSKDENHIKRICIFLSGLPKGDVFWWAFAREIFFADLGYAPLSQTGFKRAEKYFKQPGIFRRVLDFQSILAQNIYRSAADFGEIQEAPKDRRASGWRRFFGAVPAQRMTSENPLSYSEDIKTFIRNLPRRFYPFLTSACAFTAITQTDFYKMYPDHSVPDFIAKAAYAEDLRTKTHIPVDHQAVMYLHLQRSNQRVLADLTEQFGDLESFDEFKKTFEFMIEEVYTSNLFAKHLREFIEKNKLYALLKELRAADKRLEKLIEMSKGNLNTGDGFIHLGLEQRGIFKKLGVADSRLVFTNNKEYPVNVRAEGVDGEYFFDIFFDKSLNPHEMIPDLDTDEFRPYLQMMKLLVISFCTQGKEALSAEIMGLILTDFDKPKDFIRALDKIIEKADERKKPHVEAADKSCSKNRKSTDSANREMAELLRMIKEGGVGNGA